MYPITQIFPHYFVMFPSMIGGTNLPEKLIDLFINGFFKLNYELGKLNPLQQKIAFVVFIFIAIIIFGLIVALIINIFGGERHMTDDEIIRERDRDIQRKIKRQQQQLKDENERQNHRPFKLKFVEFLYQLFR